MPIPASLAERTTLRVGGPADRWQSAETTDELLEAVRACDADGTPVLLIGDGSNLVVSDSGFRGTVVEVSARGVAVDRTADVVRVRLAAGEPWDDFVADCVEQGWSGVEALSGIPGRVGSTPIQNVGAYGQEVADVVASVEAWDRAAGRRVLLDRAACGFGYRTSVFKEQPGRWIVLAVTLELEPSGSGSARYDELARALEVQPGDRCDLVSIRRAVLDLRRAKGMVLDAADHDTWSVGSFFTNPVVDLGSRPPAECPRFPAAAGVKLSAAWLIEAAGVGRGFRLDPASRAAVSSKHSLALTNRGGATCAEILALAAEVRERVRASFSIELAVEPSLVTDPPG